MCVFTMVVAISIVQLFVCNSRSNLVSKDVHRKFYFE